MEMITDMSEDRKNFLQLNLLFQLIPLSPKIRTHIRTTVLHIFLMILSGRI